MSGQASLIWQEEEKEELLEAERETKEEVHRQGADDGEAANTDTPASDTPSSMDCLEESSATPLMDVGEDAGACSSIPTWTDDNIRRSARKQLPVDRLVYEAAKPREVGSTTSKRKRTEVLASASAAAADTTDGESNSDGDAAWSSSSSSSSSSAASPSNRSTPSKNRKKLPLPAYDMGERRG